MLPSANKLFWFKFRARIFGNPLSTQSAEQAKVGIFASIPIFGSNIISSQGYAPDEILYVLLLVGSLGYAYISKISTVIILLLISILMVYRKAIQKYPQGGGSYTIAKAYLGDTYGLIAGASLTVDYVLTVAVSISSAIENMTGVFPWLAVMGHKVLADCLVIVVIAWINLRGLKESARLFALPVYLYILSVFILIVIGLVETLYYGVSTTVTTQIAVTSASGMTWFIFARAVAGGTTALTGIEAISNGVAAYKAPAQKRAIQSLVILALFVGFGLIGLPFLAAKFHIMPAQGNTILNQLGMIIFGKTIPYFILMITAAGILIIGANTSFAGLPILLSLMAKDGNVPRYFKNLGDRLVYNVGIWALLLFSLLLILIFQGNTHSMMPLYAIGVFISFTLTGIGLAKYTWQSKEKKWLWDFIIFSFGGVVSFLVFLVFFITKFTQGAWIMLVIMPLLVFLTHAIHEVYSTEIQELHVTPEAIADFQKHMARIKRRRSTTEISEFRNKVIVPVFDLNLIVLKTLKYAISLTPQVKAVHIAADPERTAKLIKHWAENHIEIPLEIVQSPYRATVHDFLGYLDKLEKESKFETITVAIPEFVPLKLRHNLLHNQTGQLMKLMLLFKKSIFVTSVPYHAKLKVNKLEGKSAELPKK
jgi:amino acid transporter